METISRGQEGMVNNACCVVMAVALVGCAEATVETGAGSDAVGDTRVAQRFCAPGATQSCLCIGGGNGVQTCETAGTGWGPCEGCASADTDVSAPSDVSDAATEIVQTDTTAPDGEDAAGGTDASVAMDGGGDATTPPDAGARSCNSCVESLAGKTFRFSSIEVTEPSDPPGLPGYLNGIWQEDMCRHILNIMLRIDSIDLDTGVIEFTAGPAWHDRDPEEQTTNPNGLPMQPGCLDGSNPVANPPSEYYFLPEYKTQITATLREDSCTFDTITPVLEARLRFHAGTPEEFFTCSPENNNEIPIEKVAATGRISDDCTMILDADLTGCIAHSAACEICAWGMAPDYSLWALEPDAATAPVACDLSYCKHHCGGMWPNFGAMVSGIFGVPRTCDLDGAPCPAGDDTCQEEGYGIAGSWSATLVELSE